jgi:hypothetical protein
MGHPEVHLISIELGDRFALKSPKKGKIEANRSKHSRRFPSGVDYILSRHVVPTDYRLVSEPSSIPRKIRRIGRLGCGFPNLARFYRAVTFVDAVKELERVSKHRQLIHLPPRTQGHYLGHARIPTRAW